MIVKVNKGVRFFLQSLGKGHEAKHAAEPSPKSANNTK